MKCATNFFRAFRDIAESVNTCGLWSVVTSWIKSFPGISSTLQLFRTIPETCPKNNNCATFCWNEMFYQEIRQMSQLPPKSRWWGMGPLKRIREIWLESRKSLFAKKRKPSIQTWEQERAQDENCKKNQPKRKTPWKWDLQRIFLIQCNWGSTGLILTETANTFLVKLCLAWNKNLPPK